MFCSLNKCKYELTVSQMLRNIFSFWHKLFCEIFCCYLLPAKNIFMWSLWDIRRLNFWLFISPRTLFDCSRLLAPHIKRSLWIRLLHRRTAPYIIMQLFSCKVYTCAFCGCKSVSFRYMRETLDEIPLPFLLQFGHF